MIFLVTVFVTSLFMAVLVGNTDIVVDTKFEISSAMISLLPKLSRQ